MKIKLLQILLIIYFILIFILLKTFSIFSIGFFIAAVLLDYFTSLKTGIKNLLYLLSALSVFTPTFSLFLIYLPFAVFGSFLTKKNFIKSYILGYSISFVPSVIIYLISTYLAIPLNFFAIVIIFYLLPAIAIFVLKKKSIEALEIKEKESIFILTVFFFTAIIAMGIVDDSNLFMSNGTREFSRLQPAVEGLKDNGLVPLYQPGTGQGEATYLWIPPSHISNFFLVNYLLSFLSPILFFNTYSFFILFISTLSLGILFFAILNKKESTITWLAVTAITLIVGLNFIFLQKLEAIKQFSAYPLAFLFLAIILENPKSFRDFFILMYFAAILMTIHPAYGFEILLIAFGLFLLRKLYIVKDRNEIKDFFNFIFSHKILIIATIVSLMLIPLFYFSNSIIYQDYLHDVSTDEPYFKTVTKDVTDYLKGFYINDMSILSLRYPDVRRIDDHKIGFLISVVGVITLILLNFMFKRKDIRNFLIFEGAIAIKVLLLAFIAPRYSAALGGLFRTNKWFTLILLGASILVFICLFKKKYLKLFMITIVAIAFVHSVSPASQNITNIHGEGIMSGTIYTNEINFIKQLPVDGRILTYGLFANAIDFGVNQLTGRYFSRDEREELSHHGRSIYNKIHNANSFGNPNLISGISGLELSNYFKLNGYKYLFLNICHPSGSVVAQKIFPDFSHGIYQNECMVFLTVNNTNYIEKIDIVENVDDEIYKTKEGYKFTTILKDYGFEDEQLDFVSAPKEPEPLQFERISQSKFKISGNFEENENILVKERYWPRWKAYMNGREIPVYPNNHDLILLKTIKGDNILLEYTPLKIEKVIGNLSLIGLLIFSILFILLLKPISKEHHD